MPGPSNLELHKAPPAIVDLLDGQVRFRQTKRRQILLGEIDASRLPILAHVAQDIGELQRDPQFDGVGDRLVAGEADDMHTHQPHGRSDAIAIGDQLVKGLVAALVQVASDAVNELLGIPVGDRVANAGIMPGHGHGVIAGLPRCQDAALPGLEPGLHIAGRAVHNVVGDPAKGVECAGGPALRPR